MNTPDRSLDQQDAFSIAELEARFEMEAVPVGTSPTMSWESFCFLSV